MTGEMRSIWLIGGRDGTRNPYLGWTVRATWLKPWGGKPQGFSVTGVLAATFAVNGGRTLIGEIITPDGRRVSAPWSRRYLSVELLSPPSDSDRRAEPAADVVPDVGRTGLIPVRN